MYYIIKNFKKYIPKDTDSYNQPRPWFYHYDIRRIIVPLDGVAYDKMRNA